MKQREIDSWFDLAAMMYAVYLIVLVLCRLGGINKPAPWNPVPADELHYTWCQSWHDMPCNCKAARGVK